MLSDQAHSASMYLTADLPLAAEPISQMRFPEAKCLLSGPSKISDVFKMDFLTEEGHLLVGVFFIIPSLCGCPWPVDRHYHGCAVLTLSQELWGWPREQQLHSEARKALAGPLTGPCLLATSSVLPSPHTTRARTELCRYPHTKLSTHTIRKSLRV